MDVTRRIRDYDTGEISWSNINETTTLRSGKVLRKRAEKILGNKVTAKAAEKEAKRSDAEKVETPSDETKGEEIVKLLREMNSPKPKDKFQFVKDVCDEIL